MCETSTKVLVNTLFYSRYTIRDTNQSIDDSFQSFQHLIHFCIDSDLNLNEDKPIPRLELPKQMTQLDSNLEEGFVKAIVCRKLIANYEKYRIEKWIQFLKCLKNYDMIAEEEPNFVSFGGIITDILCVKFMEINPDNFKFKFTQMSFYAQKFKGVIYLFNRNSLIIPINCKRNINKYSFFGLRLQYLMSDRNDSYINEFEKHFNVDKIVLKGHKMIVLNEIDAIDVNNEKAVLIDVKCRQTIKNAKRLETFYSQKLLRDWSQSVVRNVKTIVFGFRDDYLLKNIELHEVEKIPLKCSRYWSHSECFRFTDQTLNFIKLCVNRELDLYEFEFNYPNKTVTAFRYNSDNNSEHLLPKFYTN